MTKAVLRWVLPLLALFVLGPAASRLVGLLRASDASSDVTLLVNTSPAMGVAVAIGVIVLAMVAGVPASKALGARVGLTITGLSLAWAAWYTTPVSVLARSHDGGRLLMSLVAEGVIVLALGLAMLVVLVRVGAEHEGDPLCEPIGEQLKKTFRSGPGLAAMGGAVVVSLVIAWFVAREPMRGQSIFAGFVAGIGAGSAGIWCGSFVGRDVPPLAAIVGVMLVAVLAPVFGLIMPGGAGLREAVVGDALPGPVRLQSLDALVGATLGAPIGLGWVGSMLDGAEQASGKRAARA